MRHVSGHEQLIPWKEVPTVEIYTSEVAAVRTGAAFPGVRSPWACLAIAAVGANHARMRHSVLAAGNPDARSGAFRWIPATTMQPALMAAELPTANSTRKQNVQTTRIDAGGYGAMGPHPEREQPA
jgi:hypothetical protein